MVVAVLTALLAANNYAITPAQLDQTRRALVTHSAERFSTPSEAAFAASLKYGNLATEEVGAKIYVDVDAMGPYYSFGPRIFSDVDPVDTSPEIVYDDSATDGHAGVVGLWHKHALGSTWADLYGHYDAIRETHQTIWTTIGHGLYVQFFDGAMVQPVWTASVPAIRPLCTACV